MNSPIGSFLVGLGLTVVASGAVVLYLRRPLRRILVDICGTEPRAEFWTAFSNITLIVLPVIFAMMRPTDGRSGDDGAFFDIAAQLRLALIGLVVALVILGIFLCIFIFARPSSE